MRQYGRRKAGALAPEIPPLVFCISNIGEEVQFLEGFPGTFRNGAQRVFRDVDGQACLFVQELVQPAQQGSSSSQNDPPVHKVGSQFRGATFQSRPHGVNNRVELFRERFTHFF